MVPPYLVTDIYYTITRTFIGTSQWKLALKWNNHVINSANPNHRLDFQCYSRILNLINFYELRDTNLLEYQVRSAYRFLSKKERLYKFESILLDLIRRKLLTAHDSRNEKEAFIRLKKEIEPLRHDPLEKNAFQYFDFIEWLESRITKKAFADILRDRAGSLGSKTPEHVKN